MPLRDPSVPRRRSLSLGSRATAPLLVLAFVTAAALAGCGSNNPDGKKDGDSPSSRQTTAATDLSKPSDAFDLNLAAAPESFDGARGESGMRFQVFGDQHGTDLVARDGRLERSPADSFGPQAAPALVFRSARPVRALSATYTFSGGENNQENAVIGTCDISFAQGSIQFYVGPDRWALFYTVKKTDRDKITPIVPIKEGTFDPPLKTDGKTAYTSTMRVDLARSSVIVKFAGGTKTITDPHIKDLWGDKGAVQVRRPNQQDGDITFSKVWTWSP